MTENGRRRLRRFAISTSAAVAAAIGAGFLFGSVAAVAVSVVGFLGVAVASDDDLGTCLPLAVFFLIGLTLLLIALVATIKVHTG